jgi:hypothetical protein
MRDRILTAVHVALGTYGQVQYVAPQYVPYQPAQQFVPPQPAVYVPPPRVYEPPKPKRPTSSFFTPKITAGDILGFGLQSGIVKISATIDDKTSATTTALEVDPVALQRKNDQQGSRSWRD